MTFIQEHEVIEYLYRIKVITGHQKRSIIGTLNENSLSVEKFIKNTKLFEGFVGHYGCGIDCCGYKINYRLKNPEQ